MAHELRRMSGDNFVEKMLEGYRHFSGIELPDNFDLTNHEKFHDIQTLFRSQDFKTDPLVFNHSKMLGFKAEGVWMPYMLAENAIMRGANFRNAYLVHANFWEANLWGSNFSGAMLEAGTFSAANLETAYFFSANVTDAKFIGSILRRAEFERATMTGADFKEADMTQTDLRRAQNLHTATNLGHALFYRTVVTARERTIIQTELARLELFDLRD